jgi:hypothetical protein
MQFVATTALRRIGEPAVESLAKLLLRISREPYDEVEMRRATIVASVLNRIGTPESLSAARKWRRSRGERWMKK